MSEHRFGSAICANDRRFEGCLSQSIDLQRQRKDSVREMDALRAQFAENQYKRSGEVEVLRGGGCRASFKQEALLGARSSFLPCRAGTVERNEVSLAELVDVYDAVFRTQELFVVELPGRLKNVRPGRQFLRGAAVALDCVDPSPLHQYRVVVRRVSVHARLESAAGLLQQHAERPFFVVAPQDRKLNG
jgi:hypothetical protein